MKRIHVEEYEYFVVTQYGQANIPRVVSGRRADHRSAPVADFPDIQTCRLYQGQIRAMCKINALYRS